MMDIEKMKLLSKFDPKNLRNKRVVLRVDYNVPLEDKKVKDDTRIRASLDTIRFLLNSGAKISLLSHLGRPKGKLDPNFSLEPVYDYLVKLLSEEYSISCKFSRKYIPSSEDLVFYENTRFDPGEKKNDEHLAKTFSTLGDFFVNDAFSLIHREHASNKGVSDYLDSFAGFLIEKELSSFEKLLEPQKPFVGIMGGAKISDKLKIVKSILKRVDKLLVGGAMAFTFLKAKGYEVGSSLYEEEMVSECSSLLKSGKIVLPNDFYVDSNDSKILKRIDNFSSNDKGLDIGPETLEAFKENLKTAKTVFWNGPMGLFEDEKYRFGTLELASEVPKSSFSVVGGGDSVYAVKLMSLEENFSWLSTGGGASLKLVSGEHLPVLDSFMGD